jgi:hypothetical protein
MHMILVMVHILNSHQQSTEKQKVKTDTKSRADIKSGTAIAIFSYSQVEIYGYIAICGSKKQLNQELSFQFTRPTANYLLS